MRDSQLGSKVVYTRDGKMYGKSGVVTEVNAYVIAVTFEDGEIREYPQSALCWPGDPLYNLVEPTTDPRKYLCVVLDDVEPPSLPLVTDSTYIVVDISTGKTVLVTLDEDEANLFAAEQVKESHVHAKFTVFMPTNSYFTKVTMSNYSRKG
jgi:hypothetical protein